MNTSVFTLQFFIASLLALSNNPTHSAENSFSSTSSSSGLTTSLFDKSSEEQDKKQAIPPLPRVLLIDTDSNDFQYVQTEKITSEVETGLTVTIIGKNPNYPSLPLCKKIWLTKTPPSPCEKAAVFPDIWHPQLLIPGLVHLYKGIVGAADYSVYLTEVDDTAYRECPAVTRITLMTFSMLTGYSTSYAYPSYQVEVAALDFSPLLLPHYSTERTFPQLWRNLARYLHRQQRLHGTFPEGSELAKDTQKVRQGYLTHQKKIKYIINVKGEQPQSILKQSLILFKNGTLANCVDYAKKACKLRREVMKAYSTQIKTSSLEIPVEK
jgi:hypothetical protein